MSTTSSGVDINTKYQKVAAEYAKLRNQFPVLKKAVIDEQTKNAALSEELKEKEQIVRKTTVEIESLTFRNQQLAKRVEHLQTTIDQVSLTKNQKSFRSSKRIPHSVSEQVVSAIANHADNHGSVLEEELQRKLVENELLHKQIHEMQLAHESETQKLLERIKSMEADSFGFRSELSNFRNQHDAMVDELKSEKLRLQKSLESVQSRLSDSAGDIVNCRNFCESMETNCGNTVSIEERHSPTVDSVNLAVFESVDIPKIPIHDDETLNKLDVPPVNMALLEDFVQFLHGLKPHISDLANHLTNFHSYCEQRSKLYPCDNGLEELSATSIHYGALLKDKSNVCRSISMAFELICDKHNQLAQNLKLHNDIKMVFENFAIYNNFLNQLLPVFKKSIDEECLVSWCNQRLERENRSYEQMFESVIVVLAQFHTELMEFLHIATVDEGARFASELVSSLEIVVKCFQELASQYSLKIAEEHQLPVATKKLKTTNECISSSLSSIATSWNDVLKLVETNKYIIVSYLNECLKSNLSYDTFVSQHRAYAASVTKVALNSSMIPTITSSCSLQSMQSSITLPPSDLVEELQNQVKEKQKLIAGLEKEKEHWAFEAELLRMKVDQSKYPNGSDNIDKHNFNFVKEYYGDKLLELNIRLQSEESKVVMFHRESNSLINTVQLMNRQKEKLQSKLRQSAHEINVLKDELETVRLGYENQMKMLSEHLAQMNQKLTKQTDEIDMLKQALNEKTHKKGLFR